MNATRAFAVTLTIPDNEAFTACETLSRLGIAVSRVTRADIWLFELAGDEATTVPGAADSGPPVADDPAATGPGDLAATVASIETIHNPNKHRLTERGSDRPEPGEVWVAPRDERPATQVAGRAIPGVGAIRRRTAWRLSDDQGADVPSAELARAVDAFLCNPAFQVAFTE